MNSKTVSESLAQNLRRVLSVLHDDSRPEHIKKLSQVELSRKTGASRSTLKRLLDGRNSEGADSNPDLQTLIKISEALNIPVAFLLMSDSDWLAIGTAVKLLKNTNLYMDNLESEYNELTSSASHLDKTQAGCRMAKLLRDGEFKPVMPVDTVECKKVEARRNKLTLALNALTNLPLLSTSSENEAECFFFLKLFINTVELEKSNGI